MIFFLKQINDDLDDDRAEPFVVPPSPPNDLELNYVFPDHDD